MNKEEYWYWLCNIKDISRMEIKKLLAYFQDPEEIYKASQESLEASGVIREKDAWAIQKSKNHFRSMYKLEKLNREGITFIHYGSPEYPQQLLCLEDKPYSLYVKGKLPDSEFPAAGIVGARNCSGYGKEMAIKFSQALASNGVQIISGMAVGIDSYASQAAIEAGGKTFVILGSGLDVIYPAQNIELYYQIILNGGGIISEYPMGTPPIGWQFPFRNRLISAFSDKLLVIEARKQSGTLSTAAHALAQGKDIYALPGRVTDPLSEGCNNLIADGAGILLDPQYLLESFYITTDTRLSHAYADISGRTIENEAYRKIYDILSYEPKSVDMIISESGLNENEVPILLTEMEIEGLCTQPSKDCYVK